MSLSENYWNCVEESAQCVVNCVISDEATETLLSDPSAIKDYIDPQLAGRWLNWKSFVPNVIKKASETLGIHEPKPEEDIYYVQFKTEERLNNALSALQKKQAKIKKMEAYIERLKKRINNTSKTETAHQATVEKKIMSHDDVLQSVGIEKTAFIIENLQTIVHIAHRSKNNSFAKSLITYLKRNGKLSARQLFYGEKLK